MGVTCLAIGRRQTDRQTHLIVKYQACGKRNLGRQIKRLLEFQWDRHRTRGLKLCKLYDDDDDGGGDDNYDDDDDDDNNNNNNNNNSKFDIYMSVHQTASVV